MSKSNYGDLIVWQKSRALVADIYRVTQTFPRFELFGLAAQMRRAAISVPCNVAESTGRNSRRDAIDFLTIARGSILELETQLHIAVDLNYVDDAEANDLLEETNSIGRMLNGLIKYFRDQASEH